MISLNVQRESGGHSLCGPYDQIECVVAVSKGSGRRGSEAQGAVRFYDNGISVLTPGFFGALKELFLRLPASSRKYKEKLSFLYGELDRVYFFRKRTVMFELRDGRYAYCILNLTNHESFTSRLSAHGIEYEPFR